MVSSWNWYPAAPATELQIKEVVKTEIVAALNGLDKVGALIAFTFPAIKITKLKLKNINLFMHSKIVFGFVKKNNSYSNNINKKS